MATIENDEVVDQEYFDGWWYTVISVEGIRLQLKQEDPWTRTVILEHYPQAVIWPLELQ
jgi:hypothetical protein